MSATEVFFCIYNHTKNNIEGLANKRRYVFELFPEGKQLEANVYSKCFNLCSIPILE